MNQGHKEKLTRSKPNCLKTILRQRSTTKPRRTLILRIRCFKYYKRIIITKAVNSGPRAARVNQNINKIKNIFRKQD